MKKLSVVSGQWSVLVLAVLLGGCASLETVAYRTVGTTAKTVDAAMNAWGDWVRAGYATPADETAVRETYETYQIAISTVEQVVTLYKTGQATDTQLQSVLKLVSQSADLVIETVKQIRARPVKPKAQPAVTPALLIQTRIPREAT